MEWVLVILAAASVAAIWVEWRRPRSGEPAVPDDPLFGADSADLAARFAEVETTTGDSRRRLVRQRLGTLHRKRVPLRRIHGAPGRGVARLQFADGTVLLARSVRPGDMGAVAVMRQRGAVLVESFEPHPDGMSLCLATRSRRRTVIVLGLDQAD